MRLIAVILFVVLLWRPLGWAQREPDLNYIAAIVNDTIITYQEVEDYTLLAVEVLARTYGRTPDVFEKKRLETMADGLEQLIERQLILNEFKTAGGKVPETFIDDQIKEHIRQRGGSRVILTKELQARGITYEGYRQRTRDGLILDYMKNHNVKSAILISPQKVERFYATNLHQFKLDDQVKLRVIVLKRAPGNSVETIRKLAQEIAKKLDEGASFADMASIHSEGSEKGQGGDWGWVESSKVLKKGLSEVASSLQPKQPSDMIGFAKESADAYWIYRYHKSGQLLSGRKYTDQDVFVEEKVFDASNVAPPFEPLEFYLMLVEDKRAARTRTIQEVKEDIERELILREQNRLHKKWISRIREKSFVRYF